MAGRGASRRRETPQRTLTLGVFTRVRQAIDTRAFDGTAPIGLREANVINLQHADVSGPISEAWHAYVVTWLQLQGNLPIVKKWIDTYKRANETTDAVAHQQLFNVLQEPATHDDIEWHKRGKTWLGYVTISDRPMRAVLKRWAPDVRTFDDLEIVKQRILHGNYDGPPAPPVKDTRLKGYGTNSFVAAALLSTASTTGTLTATSSNKRVLLWIYRQVVESRYDGLQLGPNDIFGTRAEPGVKRTAPASVPARTSQPLPTGEGTHEIKWFFKDCPNFPAEILYTPFLQYDTKEEANAADDTFGRDGPSHQARSNYQRMHAQFAASLNRSRAKWPLPELLLASAGYFTVNGRESYFEFAKDLQKYQAESAQREQAQRRRVDQDGARNSRRPGHYRTHIRGATRATAERCVPFEFALHEMRRHNFANRDAYVRHVRRNPNSGPRLPIRPDLEYRGEGFTTYAAFLRPPKQDYAPLDFARAVRMANALDSDEHWKEYVKTLRNRVHPAHPLPLPDTVFGPGSPYDSHLIAANWAAFAVVYPQWDAAKAVGRQSAIDTPDAWRENESGNDLATAYPDVCYAPHFARDGGWNAFLNNRYVESDAFKCMGHAETDLDKPANHTAVFYEKVSTGQYAIVCTDKSTGKKTTLIGDLDKHGGYNTNGGNFGVFHTLRGTSDPETVYVARWGLPPAVELTMIVRRQCRDAVTAAWPTTTTNEVRERLTGQYNGVDLVAAQLAFDEAFADFGPLPAVHDPADPVGVETPDFREMWLEILDIGLPSTFRWQQADYAERRLIDNRFQENGWAAPPDNAAAMHAAYADTMKRLVYPEAAESNLTLSTDDFIDLLVGTNELTDGQYAKVFGKRPVAREDAMSTEPDDQKYKNSDHAHSFFGGAPGTSSLY